MKIYFAMIMDSLPYFEHQKKLVDMLERAGHEVYFPWRDEGVILENQSTEENSMKTFKNDVDHIRDCDILVAHIDGDDPGTAVEAGIAYALGKPVILYSTEFSKLRVGQHIDEVYPIDVIPANATQKWVVEQMPTINNMWLGVSKGRLVNTPLELLKVLS